MVAHRILSLSKTGNNRYMLYRSSPPDLAPHQRVYRCMQHNCSKESIHPVPIWQEQASGLYSAVRNVRSAVVNIRSALRNIRSTVRNIEREPYSDILKSAIPANPKQLSSNNLPSYSYHTRRSIVCKDISNPLPVFPTLLHFFPISLLSKMAEILCTSAFRPMEIGVTTESQRRQDGGNE